MASELPPDVLRKLFRRLSSKQRKAASMVCKEWHQAEAESRRHLKVSDSDHVIRLVSRYPCLTELDVRSCGMDITDRSLEEFLPKCQGLEVLNLSQKRFTEEYREIMEEVHPALVREGGAGRLLTDKGLETLGANCGTLKYLSLAYRSEVTGKVLESLTRGCTALRALNLTYCKKVEDRALKAIASLPRLKKLVLVGCAGFSDEGLVSLSNGPAAEALESLELKDCNQLSEGGLECIAKLVNLRVLDLEDCSPGVKDPVVARIADGCKELESVNLGNCQWVTDAGITRLVKSCHHLTSLSLSNLEGVTDRAILAITASLPGLRCLSVEGCPAAIALAFPMLVKCDLKHLKLSKSIVSQEVAWLLQQLEEDDCVIHFVSA